MTVNRKYICDYQKVITLDTLNVYLCGVKDFFLDTTLCLVIIKYQVLVKNKYFFFSEY